MFRYTAIKRSLFFGYRSVTIAGAEALVATAEKALLDLFHLHPGEWDRRRMIEDAVPADRGRRSRAPACFRAAHREAAHSARRRGVDGVQCGAGRRGSRTVKDQALALALRFDDPQRRLNALREYLQAFIMRSLHESEAELTGFVDAHPRSG